MKRKWKLLYNDRVSKGLYWDNGKENGNYYIMIGYIRGYIGIMEENMETTIVY